MNASASIEPFESVTSLQDAAIDAICNRILECAQQKDQVNISLSGGSTPKVIYGRLTQRDLPWDKIHLFWGDERNVPHDHDDSNFKMVKTVMLDHIEIPAANVHSVPVNVDDPKAAAEQYEQEMRDHFCGQENPQWDLTLLGMGDDAHTASLFPETTAIDASDRWFVENWVEKFDAFRYTLTAPAINSASEIWFLIAGAGKKGALAKVLSEDRQPALYPSQLIQPTRWFVTQDAIA